MSIIRQYKQKPALTEIISEHDLIKLLQEVKEDISVIDHSFSRNSLWQVFAIIENGIYEFPVENGNCVLDSVDLSHAHALVSSYRNHSERGCQSCRYYDSLNLDFGKVVSYCDLFETPPNVDFNSVSLNSSRISQYFVDGCEDKKQIFRRIELVLSEH